MHGAGDLRAKRAEQIRARLRAGAAVSLADAWVEELLERPVADLIDVDWLAQAIVASLESTANSQRTEDWLRERVRALRAAVPSGPLRARVPAEVVPPLKDLLGKPVVADRALVRRFMGHPAAERLMKDTLVDALRGFASRLRTAVPAAGMQRGLGRLRGALTERVGDGLLSGLTQELERAAEARIQEFVDSALSAFMDAVAAHLCDPNHADSYAAWRAWSVDAALDTDLSVLAREVDKLDPEALVGTAAAVTRAFARRQGLREAVAEALGAARELAGRRVVRDLLAEGGLDEALWRAQVGELARREIGAFVETARFGAWLEGLVADLDEDRGE